MRYTYEQNMLNAKIEYSLMSGSALTFTCPKEQVEQQNIEYVLGYMLHAIKPDEVDEYIAAGRKILHEATKYIEGDYVIRAISASVIHGEDKVINIVMTTDEDDPEVLAEWKLDQEDVFGYVYNADCSCDSELGYMAFEKRKDGTYHRIY